MKKLKTKTILLIMTLFGTTVLNANQHGFGEESDRSENELIEKVVKTYILGGDKQDISILESVMHDNYRVIVNDTKENVIKEIDKSAYLDFISKKIFGGDPRVVEIEDINISKGLNASVKLTMTSSKAVFFSQFSLVKVKGEWKVLQDMVYMELR